MVRKRNVNQKELGKKDDEINSSKSWQKDVNGKSTSSTVKSKSDSSLSRILLKYLFGFLALAFLIVAFSPYHLDDERVTGLITRPFDRLNEIISSYIPIQNQSVSKIPGQVLPQSEQAQQSQTIQQEQQVQPAQEAPQKVQQDSQGQQVSTGQNKTKYINPTLKFTLETQRFPKNVIREADVEKRDAVKKAFQDSWLSYAEDAFGADEYHPISKQGSNFSANGGVGYFIVDILDILLITGDQEGYEKARDWVSKLSWDDKSGKFSVFETTIRTLGGLLSAHALCSTDQNNLLSKRTSKLCSPGDSKMFLTKAGELATRLKPAFEANKFGLPEREVDFQTGQVFSDRDNNNLISLAEMATIQLEFKYLAHVTGDEEWWKIAERPISVIRAAALKSKSDGLMPIFFSPMDGTPKVSEIRLGSRGDSYYEYLIKQFLQTNKTELVYLDMYQHAMSGIKSHLIRQSPHKKLVHTIEFHPKFNHQTRQTTLQQNFKQDHLVCFLGGSFMLGALHVQNNLPFLPAQALSYPVKETFSVLAQEDWTVGHELIKTCVDTYTSTKTGLSPEIVVFRTPGDNYSGPEKDWYIKKPAPQRSNPQSSSTDDKNYKKPEPLIDARSILRPETVESLFIAFHLTGDEQYREWGWEIFEAFERSTRLPKQDNQKFSAFASIKDVDVDLEEIEFEDKMETFWLAETLKYLYLLFDDQNTLRLDQWVLNTEAHPLPIFTPTFDTNVI